ncbi:MAG: phage major tail tube protein [Rhizobiales bacterium]|nr:phage major tail tube protein [Hyphomicrobiales bacterium]
MASFTRKLQNADVYLEDKTLVGLAKDVDCGTIEYEQSSHKPLGGIGEFNLPGKLKAMEGSINFESFISEAFEELHPNKHIKLQIHATIDHWDGGGMELQQSIITHLTVRFFKMPAGKFAQDEATSFETGFTIMAIKQVIDGQNMREIDFINNIDNFMDKPVNAPI